MIKLNVYEVCQALNISVYTLNNWYRFKKEFPNDELAKLLPDYYKKHEKSQRYWNKNDIKKLLKFKQTRKLGSQGQMSKTIQKYKKKGK